MIEAFRLYGKDWDKVTEHVGSRDKYLIISHAYALRDKFEKNPDLPGADIVIACLKT